MSEEIYDRAMVRELSIWPSFCYGIQGDGTVKAIVFGLYANSYLLGHNYLKDIEAEELQRLIDAYDSNMAELDMEDQTLVLQIASDRYTKAIDLQIKTNALSTKGQKLNADEQEYTAKLAALDVDIEALNTKRSQIELARDRAELKNQDLEAKIQLEELARDYIAVDITQKQLEVSRTELKILMAAIRGIDIQLDIANTSLQITMAEISKAEISADIAGINSRAANYGLEPQRLAVDQAEYDAAEDEATLMPAARISLKSVHASSLATQINDIAVLEGMESSIQTSQIAERVARSSSAMAGYDDQGMLAETGKTQSEYDDNLDIDVAGDRSASQQTIETKQTELPTARTSAAATAKTAAIDAAKTMAAANIVTSLTHQIGSA